MAPLPTRAETAGRQDEDLLRHRVDLTHALVVVHDGDASLAYPQWNRPGCNTNKLALEIPPPRTLGENCGKYNCIF